MQKITFQKLARMSTEELRRKVAEMSRAMDQPPNEELTQVEEKIAALEHKHGISSDTLRQELSQGQRRETMEVCEWLMLIDLRDHLVNLSSRPR